MKQPKVFSTQAFATTQVASELKSTESAIPGTAGVNNFEILTEVAAKPLILVLESTQDLQLLFVLSNPSDYSRPADSFIAQVRGIFL